MPLRNVQAFIAIGSLIGALFIAHIVVKIQKKELPGGELWVLYLRILLGFLFAAAITFGFYSFMPASVADAAAKKPPARTAPKKPAPKKPIPRDTPDLDAATQQLKDDVNKAPGAAPDGSTIPPARIEEAEREFTRAWEKYIARDYWGALASLDRAQKANIFLVDVYYLRGLVQRRIGELDAAQKSLLGFFEVRTRDTLIPNIVNDISETKSEIAALMSSAPYPTRWVVPRVDLYSAFSAGYNRPYSVRGLGKTMGFGTDLCFADTVGNQLYKRINKNSGAFDEVNMDAPVVGLLAGDGSLVVVNLSGDVYLSDGTSLDLIGSMSGATVSDAAFMSAGEVVVTDPVNRRVAFYSFPALSPIDYWIPDDAGAFLFEPIAIDVYGSWLAMADRANGRIYFLNLRDESLFFVAENLVRDVLWSELGSLIAVNEAGELVSYSVDFAKKSASRELLRDGLKEAWSLFKYDGGIYCSNIMGTEMWQAKPSPALDARVAFLSLYNPKVTSNERSDYFEIPATLAAPFQNWANTVLPTASAIWNELIITTTVSRSPAREPYAVCFARGNVDGLVSQNLRVIPADSLTVFFEKLPALWANQSGLLTNIVIDSTMAGSPSDVSKLLAFCLHNGLQIDVWARSMPSFELVRACGATGGKVYYSLARAPVFSKLADGVKFQIILPEKIATSGYPDRATLSLHLSVAQLSAKDWLPIWVDLIGK